MSFLTVREKRDQKFNLDNLTKNAAIKQSKKNAHQENERLENLGQSSDLKARKYVEKESVEQANKDYEFFEEAQFQLSAVKGVSLKYNQLLVSILIRFIKEEDLPVKYKLIAKWNKVGVILKILNHNFQGAFKSTYLPKYDIFACRMLAVKLGNTISRLEGYVSKTDSGILTPDKGEVNIILGEKFINGNKH